MYVQILCLKLWLFVLFAIGVRAATDTSEISDTHGHLPSLLGNESLVMGCVSSNLLDNAKCFTYFLRGCHVSQAGLTLCVVKILLSLPSQVLGWQMWTTMPLQNIWKSSPVDVALTSKVWVVCYLTSLPTTGIVRHVTSLPDVLGTHIVGFPSHMFID